MNHDTYAPLVLAVQEHLERQHPIVLPVIVHPNPESWGNVLRGLVAKGVRSQDRNSQATHDHFFQVGTNLATDYKAVRGTIGYIDSVWFIIDVNERCDVGEILDELDKMIDRGYASATNTGPMRATNPVDLSHLEPNAIVVPINGEFAGERVRFISQTSPYKPPTDVMVERSNGDHVELNSRDLVVIEKPLVKGVE